MEIISDRVQKLQISGIRKFANKVAKYDNAISLTLGQPDFRIPLKTEENIIESVKKGRTKYTSNNGIEELRTEISKFLSSEFNILYDKDEICITVGGSEGIFSSLMTVINPDDKVLIPTPAYPAYESCVKVIGGRIITFNLNDKFEIDFEKLEEVIKLEKPKVLVLSYPCNPTGAVLTENDRDKLYKIIKNNDIVVVSDEIYSSLCFNDKYYSVAQYKDIKDKIILISGFSKMFSMTGLRIGYVCSSKHIIDGVIKAHAYNVSCAPSISQYAALEGLKSCMDDVKYMRNEFMKRRDYVYDRLVKMGFNVVKPNGAFYIFPSIQKFKMKSEEFCDELLKKEKVAVVPGSAFGTLGEGYIRISYCYSMEELKSAFDRIEKFVLNLNI